METGPVSKMLPFLVFRIPDNGQGPETSNFDFYTTSSEPIRLN
jgi:hypothetical protein